VPAQCAVPLTTSSRPLCGLPGGLRPPDPRPVRDMGGCGPSGGLSGPGSGLDGAQGVQEPQGLGVTL
jgi:hypothetical protein